MGKAESTVQTYRVKVPQFSGRCSTARALQDSIWCDCRKKGRTGLNALKYAYRRSLVVAAPFLVNHLIEYGYLVEKEVVSNWSEDTNAPNIIITATYAITPEGRALLGKWNLK